MLEVMLKDDGALTGRFQFDADRLGRLTSVEPREIGLHNQARPERRRVEAFLEAAYAKAFDGRIRAHYPTLISVQDRHGVIHAAAGFRFASQGPLYLEQYLDEPIEQAAARRFGQEIGRESLVEIGNLACDSPGASLFLFLALAGHLASLGATHAAATATRQLRRSFARVGFATELLTRAEPERLAGAAGDWGGYYARDPEVQIGAIAPALPALAQMLFVEPINVDAVQPRLHPLTCEPVGEKVQ